MHRPASSSLHLTPHPSPLIARVWPFCVQLCYGSRRDILCSGSRDTTIRLWSSATKMEMACLKGHQLPVAGLVINPDNTKVVSGGRDYSVRFWDIEKKEQIKMCTEPRNVVSNSPPIHSLTTTLNSAVLWSGRL
jgi:WD40 repeat protein